MRRFPNLLCALGLPVILAAIALPVSSHAVTNRLEPAYSPTYEACLKRDGAVDFKARACVDTEIAQIDKSLNATYQKLLSKLEPERQKRLQAAERAWVTYRDRQCDYVLGSDQPGTLDLVWQRQCVLRLTALRNGDLADDLSAESLSDNRP
jgi:uncharacterized protein YecT (DUF1311 family)